MILGVEYALRLLTSISLDVGQISYTIHANIFIAIIQVFIGKSSKNHR